MKYMFLESATVLVIGRKGGGKSAYGMEIIDDVLADATEKRPIITNLDVREHRFASYLKQRQRSLSGRLYVRRGCAAKMMDWCRHNWRDRGDQQLSVREVILNDGYKTFEFEQTPLHGCIYIVDEAAGAYRAREWAKFHGEADFALRSDRHRMDLSFYLIQDESLIDCEFTKLFNEVHRVHDRRNVMVMGARVADDFKVNVFANIDQTSPVDALRSYKIPFNLDLLNCYRTRSLGGSKLAAAAVRGVRGRRPIVLKLAVAGACLLPVLFLYGVMLFLKHKFLPGVPVVPAARTVKTTPPTAAPQPIRVAVGNSGWFEAARDLPKPHRPPAPAPSPYPTNDIPVPAPVHIDSPVLYGWIKVGDGFYQVITDRGRFLCPARHDCLDGLALEGGFWPLRGKPVGVRIEAPVRG